MEKMHHDGFGATRQKISSSGNHFRLKQRPHHLSLRIHPFMDFQAKVARNDGLKYTDHAVSMLPGAPAQFQYVTETTGGDQTALRQLAFEHCVGGRRRSMDEKIDVFCSLARACESGEDTVSLVGRACRYF